MQEEITNNGVRYKWNFAGPNGANFVIFPDGKSDHEIKEAIKELRAARDVVRLREANRYDLLDDYWGKVFKYAEDMYFLHWSQIEKDVPELFNAIRTGKTPEQYVDSKWKIWKGVTFNISD
jgi:hypothetical protein